MEEKDSRTNIKIVFVGDNNIGKTSLITILKGEPFPDCYIPVLDSFDKDFKFEDVEYKLSINDTPAGEEYCKLRPFQQMCSLLLFHLINPNL